MLFFIIHNCLPLFFLNKIEPNHACCVIALSTFLCQSCTGSFFILQSTHYRKEKKPWMSSSLVWRPGFSFHEVSTSCMSIWSFYIFFKFIRAPPVNFFVRKLFLHLQEAFYHNQRINPPFHYYIFLEYILSLPHNIY